MFRCSNVNAMIIVKMNFNWLDSVKSNKVYEIICDQIFWRFLKIFEEELMKIFFKTSMEKSVSLFNLCNLENVLQRNLRTGTARECIFRASGGTRFKNFCQPCWRKGGGGTPRCNSLPQKTLDTSLHILFQGTVNNASRMLQCS